MRFAPFIFAFAFVGCGNNNTNSNDMGAGGDMAMVVDMSSNDAATTGGNCDFINQTGCSTGQKCVPALGGGGSSLTGNCVADGTVTEGQACTRPTMMGAADNCVGGTICTSRGGATTVCRKLCTTDSQCDQSGQKCGLITTGLGECVPSCTPYGTDCPTGSDCGRLSFGQGSTFNNQGVALQNAFFTCKKTGAGGVFADCMSSTQCGANLDCDPNNMWCTPICSLNDNSHTCPQPPGQDGGADAGGNVTLSCQNLTNPTYGECL